MKIPREVLLKRHEAINPKLDDIRGHLVAELREEKREIHRSRGIGPAAFPILIWRQLILPSRRIWVGLAATWILLAMINVAVNSHSRPLTATAVPTPEMIQSYRQQERLLAELIGQNEPIAAEPRRKFLPQPRSERRYEIVTV